MPSPTLSLRLPVAPAPRSRAHPGELVLGALLSGLGLFLALALFYPGIATHDSLAVYDQAYTGKFGDWQPPMMGLLWTSLEQIFGYGPAAITIPNVTAYWLGFFLLFAGLRQTGARSAWLVLALGFLPPVFALLGIIWRDVIFSVLWLLAFALVFVTANCTRIWRVSATGVALGLFLLGFWLRPNALFAAAPLLIYLLAPHSWRWWRLAVFAVPICMGLQASSYALDTVWLKAHDDHAQSSILVFDLAGITHFTGQNAFPIDDWTPDQVNTVATKCYNPAYWDAIWWSGCRFAMERIDRNVPPGTKLFGSRALFDAWLRAILAHPLAYAEHRLAHFSALLTGENMVMFDQANSGEWRFFFFKSELYSRYENAMLWLNHNTPLFRGWPWLLLSFIALLAGACMPEGRARPATLGLASSSFLFTMTYLFFGVAAEYRYVYWTALSSLIALVFVLARLEVGRRTNRSCNIQ